MKADWKLKELKDLCHNYKKDIVDGPFGSNLKRDDYIEKGIPVLKIQNVKPYNITLKKMDFVNPEKYQQLIRHSYESGDIIITKLGDPLGASAIVPENIENGLIVADLVRVRAEKIDTNYLCYHLNSPETKEFINAQQKGATRPRVKISAVRELPIKVPPLAEQKQIVAALDAAFEGIARAKAIAEQNLKNAREIFESRLNHIFTHPGDDWQIKKLGEVYDIARGGSPRPIKSYLTNEVDGVNWIKIGDASASNKYIYKTNEKIKPEGISKSRMVYDGDLLLSNSMSFGRPYIMKTKGCIHDGWLVLHSKNNIIDNDFAYHLLGSDFVYKQFNSLAAGSTVRNLNTDLVKHVKIPIPPLPEQQRIVEELDALSEQTKRLEAIYQQKLMPLDELKQSILKKAFAGELVNDKPMRSKKHAWAKFVTSM